MRMTAILILALALASFMASVADCAQIVERRHIDTDDTVSDVVNHPAFKGFGRFILPLERSYDGNMQLTRIGTLLPYHSNVDPRAAVATINAIIDIAASGRTIFYDIYTEGQKSQSPSKKDTGLFFFRGTPGAPFVLVCAGGGFSYVGSVHESFPHAIELSRRGYNAFALQYRTGGAEVACEDLAAAISFILERAKELDVGTGTYALWGSSAGARMVAYLGSYGPTAYGGGNWPRPAVVVMAYTGHSDYTKNDPPTFALVGDRDGIASPSSMKRRIDALLKLGIDAEFHLYRDVGHGFGLGAGTNAEGWLDEAIRFQEKYMKRQGLR